MSFAPTISMIQERVAALFGVPRADLIGKTHSHAVTRPRHVAMALARELTERSFPEIGRAFRRDHTSVMYAVRVVPERIRRDPALRAKVERLRADLGQAEGAR
ncbi:MAG: hypothetical protein IH626_01665 [Rhodospirillales bacterium]|nr:hypothetical protein [Rhodospirillales bacterium]